MGLALQNYEQTHRGFPPGYIYKKPDDGTDTAPAPAVTKMRRIAPLWDELPLPQSAKRAKQDPGWGWAAFLLPYLEENVLAKRIDWELSVDAPENATARTTLLLVFQCPTDVDVGRFSVLDDNNDLIAEAATNSYVACFGSFGLINAAPDDGNGLFQRNSNHGAQDVTDGLSKTIAIGERGAIVAQSPWAGVMSGGTCRTRVGAPVYTAVTEAAPAMVMARFGKRTLNSPFSEPYDFFSPHATKVHFVFADASARGMATDTDLEILHALATRNGKEVL